VVSSPDLIVVDLDDTLYPQAEYLAGAWKHVAETAGRYGTDPAALHAHLTRVCAERGSGGGAIIDTALHRTGADPVLAPVLVAAFKAFRPAHLPLYPGVQAALAGLARIAPVVILTDGDPDTQHAKLDATGIREHVAGFCITDELGGRHLRKPDPAGLLHLCATFNADPARTVVIGDRPGKDLAVAHATGSRAVRVLTGEYAGQANDPGCVCVTLPTFAAAADHVASF
jgi:FMN phosphatase YigB (HAD superfamily)